jgi:hypothetical protein
MSFELLIEKGGDWPGQAAEGEIAVFPHRSNHIPGLVERTDYQALGRSTPQLKPGISRAVTR